MKFYTTIITGYAVLATIIICVFLTTMRSSEWKKVSPFTDVKVSDNKIVAQFDGEFYLVKSIEGISATKIIEVAKSTYDKKWVKRIREDIAEVLISAGAPESNHVSLELVHMESKETKSVQNAPMTHENRQVIYSNKG